MRTRSQKATKKTFRSPAEASRWMREWASTLTYEGDKLIAAADILDALTPARSDIQILDNLNDALSKRSEYWPGYHVVKGWLDRVRNTWT